MVAFLYSIVLFRWQWINDAIAQVRVLIMRIRRDRPLLVAANIGQRSKTKQNKAKQNELHFKHVMREIL